MIFVTRSSASVLCLGMLSCFALKGMEGVPLHAIYVSQYQHKEPYLSARKYLEKKLTNINLLNKRSDDSYGRQNMMLMCILTINPENFSVDTMKSVHPHISMESS